MESLQQETAPTPEPVRTRLPLRDAVRLSGMSEKTLRRKLEAGLLTGHREALDYGGFMWLIDAHSLAELYPDSAAVRDYVQQLENSLNDRPPGSEPYAPTLPQTQIAQWDSAAGAEDHDEEEDEEAAPSQQQRDFVLYLLDENRGLKEELRDRERQLRTLQDRAMNLERECGEQRGTAATQARVLEWFQRQPQPALPSGDGQPLSPLPDSADPGRQIPPGFAESRFWMTLASVAVFALLLMAIKAF